MYAYEKQRFHGKNEPVRFVQRLPNVFHTWNTLGSRCTNVEGSTGAFIKPLFTFAWFACQYQRSSEKYTYCSNTHIIHCYMLLVSL